MFHVKHKTKNINNSIISREINLNVSRGTFKNVDYNRKICYNRIEQQKRFETGQSWKTAAIRVNSACSFLLVRKNE